MNDILGSGQFGIIFKGECMKKVVAVKTVTPHADKEYIKSLLNELKVMIHIGQHPGIVNLIGAQTGQLRQGKFYVIVSSTPGPLHTKNAYNKFIHPLGQFYLVVEFCELGDLCNYLRKHKRTFVETFHGKESGECLR